MTLNTYEMAEVDDTDFSRYNFTHRGFNPVYDPCRAGVISAARVFSWYPKAEVMAPRRKAPEGG